MSEVWFFKKRQDSYAVLTVRGKLSSADDEVFAGEMKETFDMSKYVVIDMSSLDYISSSSLGIIVSYHKKAHKIGGNLVIAGVNPRVKNLLEIIGFSKIFDITNSWADTIDDAVKLLRSM
jgi:anti-anti-sigma factor